jgi:hypothetical protein
MAKRCDADDLGNLKSEMNVSVMRHLTGFLPWQRLPQGHELIPVAIEWSTDELSH